MIYDPFDELAKIHEEIDNMFNRVFKGRALLPGKRVKELQKAHSRAPVADVRETESSVTAAIELPGADKEDIDLNVTENTIEVKAQKKAEKEIKEKGFYSYKSSASQFYRAMPLPAEVKPEEANATYKNGILRIEVPKVKKLEHKKKKITIK